MRPGTNSSGEASRYLWTPWTSAEAQLPTPTMATRTTRRDREVGSMATAYHEKALSGKRLPLAVGASGYHLARADDRRRCARGRCLDRDGLAGALAGSCAAPGPRGHRGSGA